MKFILLLVLGSLFLSNRLNAQELAPSLPSNSNSWLDQKPLEWGRLKGKVVMLNVWTFACWNSYNSFPWIVSLQKKFPDLQIIGIHSPEFDYERDRSRMRDVMVKYHINYPQVLDDNHDYWKKLNNRYWPAFYIVDKQGKIRAQFAGETHLKDPQAKNVEEMIQALQEE